MLKRLMLLVLVAAHPACGPTFDLDFPTVPTEPARPCADAEAWQIAGFDGNDVVGGVDVPPAVSLSVGESRELKAVPEQSWSYWGCTSTIASVRWVSTSPAVAAFSPGGEYVWLTGRRAGDTEIRAEVTLTNGRVHQAQLSESFIGQPVRLVRVVPQGSPAAGRTVVSSGTVRLPPVPAGSRGIDARLPFEVRSAGTLDIVVDWQTVGNRVIADVCPGMMPEGLGCVPVIDGTHAWGEKPLTGSAAVTPGTYTFWIVNHGPGEEVIRYEAGLVPN